MQATNPSRCRGTESSRRWKSYTLSLSLLAVAFVFIGAAPTTTAICLGDVNGMKFATCTQTSCTPHTVGASCEFFYTDTGCAAEGSTVCTEAPQ